MPANNRVYSIKINGISESIDIVDSLLGKLNELEKKINSLSGKTVSIGAGTASKGGTAELSAEERVQKKIESTVHRIEEARTREYKTLVEAKNELKETERQQKAVAAAQRLSAEGAKTYANTLDGMREKLVDMKRALGGAQLDSPEFEKQVQEINALNQKIKEIEQSYGVFGRNVGNYVNGVSEGMQKLTITVNGSERTFTSAREALRSLGNELKTMAVQGKQGTKEYKELDRTFKQLKSTIDDVSKSSKGMDMLLDTMQGFTALGSVGNGFASLFGFDDNEIQKSIQKLVALQNVMQGVETIRKQMTTGEGLGKIFNEANTSIDSFTAKITGAKVGVNGLEASSKTATVAVKGLSTALKAVGVGLMMWAVVKAMEQLQQTVDRVKTTWHKTFGETATEEEQMQMRMQSLNNEFEQHNRLIQAELQSGRITQEQAYSQQLDLQNSYLQKQIGLLNDRNKLSATDIFSSVKDNLLSGKGLIGAFSDLSDKMVEYVASSNAAKKSDQELAESIEAVGDDVKVVNQRTGEAAEEIVNRWAKAITSVDLKTEEGRREFERLYRDMSDNKWLSTILCNLDKYIPDDAARARIQNIISSVNSLQSAMNSLNPTEHFLSLVDPTYGNKQKIKEINAAWNGLTFFEQQNPTNKAMYQQRIKEQEEMIANGGKRATAATKKAGQSVSDEAKKQEEELIRLRIRTMQDGLRKTLAEIEADANKEIDALRMTGARRAEAEKLIRQYQRKQEKAATQKHYRELAEMQDAYDAELLKKQADRLAEELSMKEHLYSTVIDSYRNNLNTVPDLKVFFDEQEMPPFFDLMHPDRARDFRINFDFVATGEDRVAAVMKKINEEIENNQRLMKMNKEYFTNQLAAGEIGQEEYERELKADESYFGKETEKLKKIRESDVRDALKNVDKLTAEFNGKLANALDPQKASDLATEYAAKIEEAFEEITPWTGLTQGYELIENRFKSLTELYEDNLERVRGTYYLDLLQQDNKDIEELYEARLEMLKKNYALELQEIKIQQEKMIGSFTPDMILPEDDGELREKLKEIGGEIGNTTLETKEMLDYLKRYYVEFQEAIVDAQGHLNTQIVNAQFEKNKKQSENYIKEYTKEVADIERALSSTQQKYGSQPTMNAFGIIDVSATRKKIDETIDAYQYLINRLKEIYGRYTTLFQGNKITLDEFEKQTNGITSLIRNTEDAMKRAKDDSGNLMADWINSIMPYAQQLVNGLSGVFNELSNLWNEQYNNRMKLLEDENDRLEELYARQEEIEAKHRDNLLLIEDEIATARGARREYLVDQYNEEIAAQRRAVAEAKRLDEEKRKNELKQKALEKQERKRQNKIQLAQAMMSQSLAIMNAFATQPFMPVGLAMGALATTLTAAQLVLMIKAQKESEKYAEGGVIIGRSHKQGGVKVLGGKAEVEGGEYITNKRTTALNQPVLDFINSKKQRLELSDFISFYNGNQKHIKGNLKHKYADGGALPAANGKKDGNIIVIKDESRPVVSVVDIVDATQAYQNVQVLAGLE